MPGLPSELVDRAHCVMGRNVQIVTELVERTAHDSVRAVECLFDAITVMDIDVNVQNSRVESAVQN